MTTMCLARACLAEALSTCLFVALGIGVVAQSVLSGGTAGSILSIHLGWGLAVMLGIHVAHDVSGAHMNPAVSLTLAISHRFEWTKLGPYVLSQVLGAFVGAALVYSVYYPSIQAHPTRYSKETAAIFATYPQPQVVPIWCAVWTEMVGTAVLLCGILAITDDAEEDKDGVAGVAVGVAVGAGGVSRTKPMAIGLLVVVIGMAFGFNTGYAINPARDFGPRLFLSCAGWGSTVWTDDHYYFLVPLIAPFFGSIIGAGLYRVCIEMQQHDRPEDHANADANEDYHQHQHQQQYHQQQQHHHLSDKDNLVWL